MCIILASIGTDLPTARELQTACANNPDGFGIGIVSRDPQTGIVSIHTHKTMSAAEACEHLPAKVAGLTTDNGHEVLAWAFHARIATHGSVRLENCHPFALPNSDAVMFHNGVLDVQQAKTDDRTDSQTFAEDYLPAIGGVPATWQACDVIGAFAKGSKLAFLIADETEPLVIVNEDLGHWSHGIWRSNHSYEPYTYGAKSWSSRTAIWDTTNDGKNLYLNSYWCDMPECGERIDEQDEWCRACYQCFICTEDSRFCECYEIVTDDENELDEADMDEPTEAYWDGMTCNHAECEPCPPFATDPIGNRFWVQAHILQ